MKGLFIILFGFLFSQARAQTTTVVDSVFRMRKDSTMTGFIQVLDRGVEKWKKGSVSYQTSDVSILKIVENTGDERWFTIMARKEGPVQVLIVALLPNKTYVNRVVNFEVVK